MPLIGLLAGRGAAHAMGDAARYAGGALLVAIGAWQMRHTARPSRKREPASVAVSAAVSVVLSLLGLEFGRRLAAAVEVGSQYLAGIVLVAVGILVAVGEL